MRLSEMAPEAAAQRHRASLVVGPEPSEDEVRAWCEDAFPNDLGDGNHRWSWLVKAAADRISLPPGVANYVPTVKDIMWLHRCKNGTWCSC